MSFGGGIKWFIFWRKSKYKWENVDNKSFRVVMKFQNKIALLATFFYKTPWSALKMIGWRGHMECRRRAQAHVSPTAYNFSTKNFTQFDLRKNRQKLLKTISLSMIDCLISRPKCWSYSMSQGLWMLRKITKTLFTTGWTPKNSLLRMSTIWTHCSHMPHAVHLQQLRKMSPSDNNSKIFNNKMILLRSHEPPCVLYYHQRSV